MTTTRPVVLGLAIAVFGAIACSGSSTDRAGLAQDVEVTISPDSGTLAPAEQQTFAATVTGTIDPSVTWAVVEGAAGGSVNASGTYTAPAATGTYHVVVTSNADPTKSATAIITVTAAPQLVTVAVTPKTATIGAGASQGFSCAVTGSSDTACTWSIQEGVAGGAITSAGVYTAPANAGTYHVVATSHADTSKTDVATVTVTAAPVPVSVAISPKTTSAASGASKTFTCTVTGASDTRCTWSVQEGTPGGSITSSGVYTAPATAGTYHVVARSRADTTKTDVATVTVTAAPQPVTVAVSPKTATVVAGGTQAFTCAVSGSTDTACTWSVQEGTSGGSVTTSGVYTAPATAGTYHVVARSHADTTKTDVATVTVTATPQPVTVAVSPKTATVVAGGTQAFTCSVSGSTDTACTWSVQEGTSGGSVTTSGLYTAPATAGTYHVVARSHADTTKTDVATVTVTSAPQVVAISITPATASVDACQTYTFRASVTGTSNTAVTWSVTEGSGGSVNTSGVYTAPPTGGTYHVVATSQADPTKSQSATVTVTERIVSVSVSPTSTTVTTGGTVQFTATVTTTCGAFTQTQALAAGN